MIKKTVEYEDFNGELCKEDIWFGITKSEIIKAELHGEERLTDVLQRLIDTKNYQGIMQNIERIMEMAYGVKSPDGKRFLKSPKILEEFKASAAYDAVYMEIISDPEVALKFFRDIMPADIAAQMNTPEVQAKVKELMGEAAN